jgi:methyl-accepting chemotaxis protein
MRRIRLRITVGKKLLFSFGSIVLMMVVSGWMGLSKLADIHHKAEEMNQYRLPKVTAILEGKYLTEHTLTLQLRYTSTSDLSRKQILQGEIEKAFAQVDEHLAQFQRLGLTTEEEGRYRSLQVAWEKYKAIHQALVQAGPLEVDDHLREAETMFQVMEGYVNALAEWNAKSAAKATDEASALYREGVRETLIYIVAALVVSCLLAYRLTRSVRRALQAMSDSVNRLAAGELSVQPPGWKRRDEFGDLAGLIARMQEKLRETVGQVNLAAVQVATAAEQLAKRTEETKQAAGEIASSLEEVASGAELSVAGATESARAMEELAAGVERVAESASALSDMSLQTTKQASEGYETIRDAVRQMGDVTQAMHQSAAQVEKLGNHSRAIEQIVELISEIAAQTDLLALNASIEAARAGEHGRGFSVVADEVRRLAEQTKQSAMQIGDLVKAIRSDTAHTVDSFAAMTGDIERGAELVTRAGEAFGRILSSIEDVSGRIQELSAVSQQMSAGTQQVSASVEQSAAIAADASRRIQQVSQTTRWQVQVADETDAAVQSLREIVRQLETVMGWFKV